MIAYVDSSVLLRIGLQQPNALSEWEQIERGISSALIKTESLRALDRIRQRARLPDAELSRRRAKILELIASLELSDLDSVVLDRAAQSMPTEVGTLDAIHLATALLWSEMTRTDLVMATHDSALALAARAHGLRVVGVAAP